MEFADIERYLPKYLSQSATEELFSELECFPENINDRLYTSCLSGRPVIFQGDGLAELPAIHFPDTSIRNAPGIILSNTCDLDTANLRFRESRINFAILIRYDKYHTMLVEKFMLTGEKDEASINSHLERIRKQRISHMFYLPASGKLLHDSIAVFDTLNNIPSSMVEREELQSKRLFTLSNYGFYLFVFKLSIHFTRIREGVDRNAYSV